MVIYYLAVVDFNQFKKPQQEVNVDVLGSWYWKHSVWRWCGTGELSEHHSPNNDDRLTSELIKDHHKTLGEDVEESVEVNLGARLGRKRNKLSKWSHPISMTINSVHS